MLTLGREQYHSLAVVTVVSRDGTWKLWYASPYRKWRRCCLVSKYVSYLTLRSRIALKLGQGPCQQSPCWVGRSGDRGRPPAGRRKVQIGWDLRAGGPLQRLGEGPSAVRRAGEVPKMVVLHWCNNKMSSYAHLRVFAFYNVYLLVTLLYKITCTVSRTIRVSCWTCYRYDKARDGDLPHVGNIFDLYRIDTRIVSQYSRVLS